MITPPLSIGVIFDIGGREQRIDIVPCKISDWSPGLGDSLLKALAKGDSEGCINIGCVAAHGYFDYDKQSKTYEVVDGGKPATAFLLKLISELQYSGTVPMIDVMEYSKWLTKATKSTQ